MKIKTGRKKIKTGREGELCKHINTYIQLNSEVMAI